MHELVKGTERHLYRLITCCAFRRFPFLGTSARNSRQVSKQDCLQVFTVKEQTHVKPMLNLSVASANERRSPGDMLA